VTTVLICDDRRSVREGLTRVMSAVTGVSRIDCVAHGDELLARFARQPVDVVLVGTQHPGNIGSAARAMKTMGLERMVQFVTGMANIRDVIPFPRTPGNAEF
jgi:DNA-binding NarL/FixJ family response regulator